MRIISLFLVLLLLQLKGLANPKSDYVLTLAINMADCLNCNKTMHDLQMFKTDFQIKIVMREEFKQDSVYILGNYDFNKIADEVIWSDSLYEAYSPNEATVVAIESKYKTDRYTLRIHDIEARNFLDFLSRQNKQSDTLFKDYPGLARGVNELKFNNGLLGMNVVFNKTIQVFDVISQKKKYQIDITDDILRRAFAFNEHNLPPAQYTPQHIAMKQAGVPNIYEINDFCFADDTLLVKLNHWYFRYRSEKDTLLGKNRSDTLLWYNFALIRFDNGKKIDVSRFEFNKKVGAAVYYAQSNMHYDNGNLYERVTAAPLLADRAYIAQVNLDNNHVFTLNPQLDRPVLKPFRDSDFYGFHKYYKGTFAYIGLGKIFSLESGKELEKIAFFPNPTEITDEFVPKAVLSGYVISKEYLWFLVDHNDSEKQSKFYRLNRATRAIETSELTFPVNRKPLMDFDPLNPDYLIYKNKQGFLVREKLF